MARAGPGPLGGKQFGSVAAWRKEVAENSGKVAIELGRRVRGQGGSLRSGKTEFLQPMVVRVEHDHFALRVERQGPGLVKLPRPASGCSEQPETFTVATQFLDAVVAEFRDEDSVLRSEPNPVGIFQLAGGGPFLTDDADQIRRSRVQVENLQAVIARIGNPKLIQFVNRQGLRAEKLPRLAAMTSPLANGSSRGIKLLNPIEVSVLCDVIVARSVLYGIRDKPEFAQCPTVRAPDCAFRHGSAIGLVKQDPEIVGVGDHQQAIAGESQPARLAIGNFRCPPTSQIAPLAIKHLNAPGHVDDIDLIPGIQLNRPGFGEMADIDSAATDELHFGQLFDWLATGQQQSSQQQ